jgi:hypothetical protein
LFSGPYGGTELSLFSNGKVNIGDGVQRNRELGKSWGAKPNINLIPYLVAGVNKLETITAVGGGGETYITMYARMLCNGPCTETWTDQCSALNARAQ